VRLALPLILVPAISFLLGGLLGGVLLLRRRAARRLSPPQGYEAVPAFLSVAERSFFGVLQQAFAADYLIFVKVRLADLVRPARNNSRSAWQTAFNRIAAKHVDFVLCDPADLAVRAVIELDDASHKQPDRSVRDALVDSALDGANIPVLRIAARLGYSASKIQEQLKSRSKSAAFDARNRQAR